MYGYMAVHALVAQCGAKVVCEFPSNFDSSARTTLRRLFLVDLEQVRITPW